MKNLYREFRAITVGLINTGKASGEFRADVDAEAIAAWLDGMILQYRFDKSLHVQCWADNFLK